MMQLVDVSIILALILFVVPASSTIPEQISPEQISQGGNGYDCGKYFFTDQIDLIAIKEAFSDVGRGLVMPYSGPLYSQTMNLYIWPLLYDRLIELTNRIWRASVYQLVFTEHGEIIGAIVKIANNDFVGCWRTENYQPKAQLYDLEQSNGYYCGQKFIPNEDLSYSRDIAITYIGKGRQFPAAYTGHLYNADAGFLIWPIYRGQVYYKYGNGPKGPYYIVIDPKGQIQDVIVKTVKQKSFVRCIKSRNDLSPPYVDAERSTAVGSSTTAKIRFSGFRCDDAFFSDNDLETARKTAKVRRNSVYPKLHHGYPCDSFCLLWPVRLSGIPYGPGKIPFVSLIFKFHKLNVFSKGRTTPYRLVLSLEYEIMCVIIKSANDIKKCDRKIMVNKVSNEDKNHYRCGIRVFKNHELLSAAKAACQKKKGYYTMYPRHYEGAVFEVEGPYQIYPLKKDKKFKT
ncbi:hypothetical protein EPUL_005710, partial [Erysiphe pulchra]